MPTSRSSFSTAARAGAYQPSQTHSHSTASQGPSLTLTLWIHDSIIHKEEAWLNYNLFPPGACKPGDIVEVRRVPCSNRPRKGGNHSASEGGGGSSSAEGRIESGEDENVGAEKRRSGVTMRRSKSDPVGVAPAGAQEGANLLLVVKEMEKDMLVKQPTMQVYILLLCPPL